MKISRRDFIKLLGVSGVGGALVGCDRPSMVNLEEGKENIVSYLLPEEAAVPGLGLWYASVCLQCGAGCGVHGRVREGRPLKLEGNPDSPINAGKSCQMGQAGLQAHYNPDRISRPLLRQNGKLQPATWEDALEKIDHYVGSKSSTPSDRIAWVSGTLSGHQRVLLQSYLQALGSSRHYATEVVNTKVMERVNRELFGIEMPTLRFDKAKLILSFGADFLGTWLSPVHFARQFAAFRGGEERGSLIQVEGKMSLTGANADLWVAARPGSEGVLAMGIANYLINHSRPAGLDQLPQDVIEVIRQQDSRQAAAAVGLEYEQLRRIAKALQNRSPSLVLAGASAEGQEQGYASVMAIQLLNVLLGNVSQTIESAAPLTLPQLAAKTGGSGDLLEFSQAIAAGELDVVFFSGANPLYNAPESLQLKKTLQEVPLKVALAQFPDETTMAADIVLPLSSALEDWGTHLAAYQPEGVVIGFQQPLMEPLYPQTRGLGDILLALLKRVEADKYRPFADYYTYLRNAVSTLQTELGGAEQGSEAFWQQTLASGQVQLEMVAEPLKITPKAVSIKAPKLDSTYPFTLVPSPRMGLFDGRHANLPWLQESPDQISKVVWDSWAEIHPETAAKLEIAQGDLIKISSASGSLELKAYLTKAVHKQVVAIPLGQGHTAYGRYAQGVGVNPLTILNLTRESVTGELAMYATQIKLERGSAGGHLVRMGGSDTQRGRQIVRTVSIRRPEGV